ncbi:hypothetical protein E4P40_10680 [Blastococcus sp. CT_GayMR20]|uniref:hypothetical protein n=1 Tax=Blastococcus sp. CT_GayMR20 TaxID=2559609 RepID=UPI0010734438|nr:hypothetical protein [Blastococcus sp. CT_GayMR20]TFV88085.1 hypothetical protein E4P40_10680 [Blastococcus sp. CT_GayMR20]
MFRPRPSILITGGALGIAATTALEVVTGPYSPDVRAFWLNGPVHVAKVLAILALAAGLLPWARSLARDGQRVPAVAAGLLAATTVVGAGPYSVVEATLDRGLTPAAASARLDSIYADQAWVITASSVALPVLLLALVVFAVVVLGRRLLPRWAPLASLASVPVAVLAGILTEAGWPLPHPPAWLFLGLAAYGAALVRVPGPDRVLLPA